MFMGLLSRSVHAWRGGHGRGRPAAQRRAADKVQIDGEPTERSFTATFSRAGRPVAALLVDRVRALPAMRELIEKGAP